MDPERWRRIDDLFAQALERSDAERAGFLAAQCGGDDELLRELEVLLAAAPTAGAALDKLVAGERHLLAINAVASRVGDRIGPYRLIRLLGAGGMGAVYLAERDDSQFTQRVAIKLLPHGSDDTIARFRDERQILAALEHPNIVRLLDGGNTDDKLPYLVMEHIEGTTITRFATDRHLPVRARVALIRRVCAALQYAHQNLIVHRDIKPGNILVDASGEPKILDFGIAKLLAPVSLFQPEARTRTGYSMFTPEYGSPEQARGLAVSTATDVYSVGAVLYELITGEPAHRSADGAYDLWRVICEIDPQRPSAVCPAASRRELAGDLDNIILKALHKEPARRYASMAQLGDDLGRWLDGLPVAARNATMSYRLRKFVRRNKAAVFAATVVAAALVAATGVSLRQARRADEQAARAEASKAVAVDAAARERAEADRARKAEAEVQAKLDQIKAEQAARTRAEEVARAKGSEAELSREQLKVALSRAREDKHVAETNTVKAREAESRAEVNAAALRDTQKKLEVRLAEEQAHVKQLEQKSKEITHTLR
jgi:eukaryotic-like serine/threonine-protein kinase